MMVAVPEKITAYFAGSFNPFTRGHAGVVARALAMGVSRVVIGVGENDAKTGTDAEALAENIRPLYAGEPRVAVEAFSGLTVDAAMAAGATCLLRGVRSVKDFEYERDIADVNRRLSQGRLETILLFALPEEAWLSSSLVRELQRYGRDVSLYLPTEYER